MPGADLRHADLCYASLNYADLRHADLRRCILPHTSILAPKYIITWWGDTLAIGCQQHSIEQWLEFSDREIAKMEPGALEWLKVWKPLIMSAIEATKGVYE